MACSLRWILTAFFIQAADSLHQNGLLTEDQYQMALCVKSIAVQNFPPGRMAISLPDTVSKPPIHHIFSSVQPDTDNFALADFVFKTINEERRWNLKSFIPTDDPTNPQFVFLLNFRDEIPLYHIVLVWSDDEEMDITEIITNQLMAMILSFYTNQRGRFLVVMPGFSSDSVKELLLQIFENLLNFLNIFDVAIVIPAQDETRVGSYPIFDIYTWFPFQSRIPSIENIVHLTRWLGTKEGGFIHNRDLYPNKMPISFSGRKIKVSAVVHVPLGWLIGNYTDEDGEVNYNITGPEFDLLQIICEKLHLHILYLPPNPKENLNTQRLEMYFNMMNLYSDVAVGFLSLFIITECVLDYTIPILTLDERLFVPCPGLNSILEKMGEIFDIFSWIAMLVVFLLFTLIMFLLAKNRSKTGSKESSAYKNISSCLYNVWAVHLGVSVTDMPRTTILRALFIMCVWYAYAMGNLFQIYFTSFLVDPGLEKAVTNTEEYIDAHLSYGLHAGLANYFKSITYDIPNLKSHDCFYLEECIKGLFNSKNYSTVTYQVWVEYYSMVKYPRRETKICFLTDRHFTNQYSILLTRGSPYLHSFNRVVRRILESGIMAHLMKNMEESYRYIHIPDADLSEEQSDYFVFTLSHMKFAFSALMYGCTLGGVLLVCEIIYYKISTTISKKVHSL